MSLLAALARFILAAAVFAFVTAVPAQAVDPVGAATRVQGKATATNGAQTRDLQIQSLIHKADQLATEIDSRLEVTLIDKTILTLGASATLKVNEFVFQDPANTNALQLFAVGAFKMVSGAVNKPDGGNIQVITPVGVLGIRGTHMWSGPINGTYGVFLIDGEVTVSNSGGSITLTEPGSGTNIADINTAPGAVTQWPQDKIQRALAAVAFQ